MLDELRCLFVAHVIEEAADVRIEYPVHSLPLDSHGQCVKRLIWAAPTSEPITEALEVGLRSTLQAPPQDDTCKTRGQDGFATSFPAGDLHPLQHAGLSRRSAARCELN